MNLLTNYISQDAVTTLVLFVNGKKVTEPNPDPKWSLLWYLRNKLHLTGTKYGCGEGGCGACTVMVSQYLQREDRVKHIAVNACLTPVCAMHGLAVTTVEGIGSTQDRLHPVQDRLAKAHGSQCGFCTPGIVMSMYALLRNKVKLDYNDIETALQGNLCRCTGYRPIIEGFKTFTEGWEKQYCNDVNKACSMGKDCCKVKNDENDTLYKKSSFLPYDPTQEPIFPPELRLDSQYSTSYLFFKGENVNWIRPKSLEDIMLLKQTFPESKIIVGNTEVGIEMKFKNKIYPILISPLLVDDMNRCHATEYGITVGANVSLSELKYFLEKYIIKENKDESKIFKTIVDMLHWFAGNQVRNVASLVGNIITASPISDLNPILLACSATVNVHSQRKGHRKVVIDDDFFISYRKTAVDNDELITSVEIPFSSSNKFIKAYKQARRRDDDISIVTAAFYVNINKENNHVLNAKFCYGGMGPVTIFAKKSSEVTIGLEWNEDMLNVVNCAITNELQLESCAPGGMVEYRKSLCLSLFFKFYVYVLHKISNERTKHVDSLFGKAETSIQPESSQCFEITQSNKESSYPIGKPIIHASALKQTTGEAIYCDDLPKIEGELYLTLVFSKEPHAKILTVDASKALATPGVEMFLSANDLQKECNEMGPIFKDEEIFSRDVVTSRACVIGAVVAQTENIARKARDLVNVTYEKLEPVIITLEEAIIKRSFFPGYPRVLKKGNIGEVFEKCQNVRDGLIRSGAQEHFYLETISAYAVRREDELEIISTTQNPAEIGQVASHALGIPNHKIVSKVKRIGGGFGGKEVRAAILAAPVAIAAYKTTKPVRAVLERDEDMQVTGYRHPCLIQYKVAFDSAGKILGAKFDVYCNAGYSMDISCSMIERAITHVDNCYYIPNIEVNGYVCKTNLPSNTAFRGFGAPKAMLAAESMIRDIASALGKTYEEIAVLNMYEEGNLSHFNQPLTRCTISRCWNECIEGSDYWKRKQNVDAFNSTNRWKKKGLAIVPTKYGISFQTNILMQAGALLHIYNDGSVLLSIGGIEMGQGLFTKMIQVASKALEVNIEKIHISEMATDKVPNSSPTAGSISSDLYGMAVITACETLKERLQPFKESNPSGKWEDWVMSAYLDRISLSATGFYAAPKIQYDPKTNCGHLFEYFTYGVACSEVIIDCLTGDHQVLRTDIVMDVGESLNPAIDIGQIEGAFMQGYGFHTIEEMLFSPSGEVLSRGPGTYKIPGFSDIPKVFNVSLLKGAPNPRAVYSSKAIGEPPLFLASSVYFAIKEAISSARKDAGALAGFHLEVPATCARIRMACEDQITRQIIPTIKTNGKPWNVVS